MTLPPIDSWDVRGVAGPSYKVGPRCANANCKRLAEHAHHMWRRSFLAGDFSWVELPDGTVLGNIVGLCPRCHDLVTGRVGGHKAAIRMSSDHVFWWCEVGRDRVIEYEFEAPLEPQPPTRESLVASPASSGSDRCPTCGQQQTAAKRSSANPTPAGERRRRKSWVIQVPDDEEDGATALDVLVDDLSPIFGYEQHPNTRYFTVARALVHAQQDKQRLATSDRGRGE